MGRPFARALAGIPAAWGLPGLYPLDKIGWAGSDLDSRQRVSWFFQDVARPFQGARTDSGTMARNRISGRQHMTLANEFLNGSERHAI